MRVRYFGYPCPIAQRQVATLTEDTGLFSGHRLCFLPDASPRPGRPPTTAASHSQPSSTRNAIGSPNFHPSQHRIIVWTSATHRERGRKHRRQCALNSSPICHPRPVSPPRSVVLDVASLCLVINLTYSRHHGSRLGEDA